MAASGEILTTEEMARADRLAIEGGVASLTLMENAGKAVADEAARMVVPGARIAVFCGPGNNGGDGFVAARHLKRMGFDVRVFLLGDRAALKGDAAEMARRYDGPIREPHIADPASMDLLIDALFGAGLSRPLDGEAAKLVEEINAAGKPVLAIDVPSGLDGTAGAAAGPVVRATKTATFFRMKPGHLLMPGAALCGAATIADIGIPDAVLDEIKPAAHANTPALWRSRCPHVTRDAHKYNRGHAVVVSGPADATGAARLGARGALRIGAGLVTVVGTPAATAVNAVHLTAIMVRAVSGDKGLSDFLSDVRRNAVLFGPGASVAPETAENALTILKSAAAVVLDADALTAFVRASDVNDRGSAFGFTGKRDSHSLSAADLFAAIRGRQAPVVLTPHEGEFKKLFPDIAHVSKLERTREAAHLSGAVVVLKGADTVIAAPGGRAAINTNAPPTLATAGSGDVLAGFVTGLLAQRMPVFEAACAAVWLHGACATAFGPGLIAEDLPEVLPTVLRDLDQAVS